MLTAAIPSARFSTSNSTRWLAFSFLAPREMIDAELSTTDAAPPADLGLPAVGADVEIMLDTNCSWTPVEARSIARRLKPYDLRWLEEPIFPPEDFQSLALLRAEGGIPVAAGENACTAFEFQKIFAEGR